MSFFDKLGEFLYGNLSTEYADNAVLHQEVAAGQSANYDQLEKEGKISALDNFVYQREITTAGNMTAKAKEKDSSYLNLLSGVPWYVWLLIGGAVFYWIGGFTWLARKSRGVLK